LLTWPDETIKSNGDARAYLAILAIRDTVSITSSMHNSQIANTILVKFTSPHKKLKKISARARKINLISPKIMLSFSFLGKSDIKISCTVCNPKLSYVSQWMSSNI